MDAMSLPESHVERAPDYPGRALWRRTLFFGLTFITALAGGFLMLDILRANGLSGLQIAGLVMFTALFAWISGAFWTAVAGFVIRLIGRDPAVLNPAQLPHRCLQSRIAIVAPIYNEDTARVFAGIEATWRSLRQQREQDCFDFFVLSDTRREEIARDEEAAWRALVERLAASGRIFYRRRADNVGRKSGNHRRFRAQLGRRLRLHDRARCRQHHVGPGAGVPGAAHGRASGGRASSRRCRCSLGATRCLRGCCSSRCD